MKKIILALILASIIPATTQAGTGLNCSEAESANFNDGELSHCVEQETAWMKDNLSQLGKTYTHLSWNKIQASQAAWQNYMKANCAFHELNAGGGGADVRALNQCKIRMMVERNKELDKMAAQ